MRRLVFLIGLLAIIITTSGVAIAQSKVDPFFDTASQLFDNSEPIGSKAMGVTDPQYEVFIKTFDTDRARTAIEDLGGIVRLEIGNILTARIPAGALGVLNTLEEIIYIEAAKPLSAKNDVALNEINGNEVHIGTQLPDEYTGADTIVGIVDDGIDYTHPDFKGANGANRILYIWDQNGSAGDGPAEFEATYGTECDTNDIRNGSCSSSNQSGHGTHVAGSAVSRDSKYMGVAPDASIVAVKYKSELQFTEGLANPLFSTTICEAAYYVFEKAKKLGKPAVVNLSLGSHIGPHDGTSLFEECLDTLLDGTAGRAIIAAAGNENSTDSYYTGLHAGYDVSSRMATNFRVKNFSAGRIFYIDIWQKSGSNLNFGIAVSEGSGTALKLLSQSRMATPGTQQSGSFVSGKIAYQINATETASPLNGRPHVGITINFSSAVVSPAAYSFDLIVEGSGHFDAWLFPDKPAGTINFTSLTQRSGVSWNYVPGDRIMSVTVPATAKNVIAVAAYTTRNEWGSYEVNMDLGDILSVSSVGPSADSSATGQKPEIAAPGAMIASTKSADLSTSEETIMEDGQHVIMAGTSMAAPFVSGTAALLFSINPNFTHEDIERILTESAYIDDFVGTVPNNVWGYGKLDVYRAVETALGREPTGSFDNNPSIDEQEETDDEEASTGGSMGCQLVFESPPQGLAAVMIPLVLSAAAICIRRFRYRSTN